APPPGTPPVYPIKHEQSREKWTGPMWTPAPRQHKSFQTSILGLDSYISPSTDPLPPIFEDGGQVMAEAGPRSCRRCGAETDIEDLFCRHCGSDFDQDYSQ